MIRTKTKQCIASDRENQNIKVIIEKKDKIFTSFRVYLNLVASTKYHNLSTM